MNLDRRYQLISVCGMEPTDISVRKDAWKIGKLAAEQKRNARPRSLGRQPKSRLLMDKTKIRLSVDNVREMPSIHDKPLRPLDENPNVATTGAPGITDDSTLDEKQLPNRILHNEQQSILLNQQLQNITNTANHLANALQKATGQITSQQELHQNNLSQREECLMRSRMLLGEQRQFNVLTQQQCSTAQHRMDQYGLVTEELSLESRTLHANLHQQAQQGHLGQQSQAGHEAETVRLRDEMIHMWNGNGNGNFRRRGVEGGRSSRSPKAVALGDLARPMSDPSYPQKTWAASEKTGRGAQDPPLPKAMPPFQTQFPTINHFETHVPGPSTAPYSSGSGAINQPAFVPIIAQESCPSFTPAMYSNWTRGIKIWLIAQHGIPATHILARIIAALPLQCRIEATNYMDSTEMSIRTRSLNPIWDILGIRFGRADEERSCSWLAAFADFRRDSQENYKDPRARFTRCVAKQQALGKPLTDTVISNKAIKPYEYRKGDFPRYYPHSRLARARRAPMHFGRWPFECMRLASKQIHQMCTMLRFTENEIADSERKEKVNRNPNGWTRVG